MFFTALLTIFLMLFAFFNFIAGFLATIEILVDIRNVMLILPKCFSF